MFEIATHTLSALLAAYGYWAVFLCIAGESAGIPLPGETMLLAAAVYGGTTHHLSLILIVAAAAAGAIVGDNLGYLLGREGGYRLLRRYGHYIGLDERRLKLGRYLFLRHGGKVVFVGRFIAVLRMWAAFLAGAHRMPWRRFLLYNAAGGAAWATLYGLGGYTLGNSVLRAGGPLGYITMGVAAAITVVVPVLLHRNEGRLADEAERALPGPLDGAVATPRRTVCSAYGEQRRTAEPLAPARRATQREAMACLPARRHESLPRSRPGSGLRLKAHGKKRRLKARERLRVVALQARIRTALALGHDRHTGRARWRRRHLLCAVPVIMGRVQTAAEG